MSEEDDKPTVVLDITALKAELAEKKNVSDAIDQEIEFFIHEDTQEDIRAVGSKDKLTLEMEVEDDLSLIDESLKRIVFFDYSSEYFTKLVPKLPSSDYSFEVITTLPELNKILQSGEKTVIIFHYNAAPKAVNQLSSQIKSKFINAKTIIVAKGLSPAKANTHKQSKSGANAYLSVPFSIKQFKSAVNSI